MSTKLDKTVIRESSEVADNRNIIVSLCDDQSISFKLKGMKSGTVSIKISDLYNMLTNKSDNPSEVTEEKKPVVESGAVLIDHTKLKKIGDDVPCISLYDFRSQYLISKDFTLEIKTKLEAITVKLINELKK